MPTVRNLDIFIHHEKLWKPYRISRGNYPANCRNSKTQLRPHMCRIKVLLNVKGLGFMLTSVLRQAFPVDQETNNFVRQVHNRVFLFYILFRLDIILPFSSISSEVLTEILDLKTTARDGIDSFLRILAEISSCQTLLYCPTDTADIR